MKKLIILAFISISTLAFSQEKLVIEYHFNYELDLTGVTDPKTRDFIKNTNENTGDYTLVTTKNESYFNQLVKIDNSQGNGPKGGSMMAPMKNIYRNVDENYFLEFMDFNGKKIIIKDSLKSFNWVIEKEKSKILGYEVRKAVFRRDKTTYEAWYAPKLDYKNGPADYAGLPGLILKITEISPSKTGLNKMHYVATSVKIDESAKIEKPTKGQIMTQKEFNQFTDEYMKRVFGGGNDVEIIRL